MRDAAKHAQALPNHSSWNLFSKFSRKLLVKS